ncbi:MAG TPA: helix-turn-helix domain-containing protein [Nitrososphaerales archaeon]|nr:helix-turn-helix domain-containing protein [Nitrososphaerales archaeon]HUK74766.1 helix-turn-helix domain-containing protein [Nitrososphaerales archaeon]
MEELVLGSGHPHGWLRTAVDRYSGSARILDSKILGPDMVEHLFEINVKPEQMKPLLSDIARDRDVMGMEIVQSKSGRIQGAISTARCTICKEVAASRCFLGSVEIERGKASWTILGDQSACKGLLDSLERRGIPFRLDLKRSLDDRELLTARQEEVLYMAYERGYFDFPKKIGVRGLAAATGVKTSTLTEILRRGQKKIVAGYFGDRHLQHPHSDV